MDDAELNAIRQARLAELQRNAAGGGSSTNPSSSSSGGAQDSAQENMTITILNRVLTNEARERLSRVKIVRPDRAQAVENYIIKLYSMGQIHQKLGEKDIVQILDGLSRDSQQKQQTKITFNRKNIAGDDEDDDDFFD
ncbi:programmed cell death protein 5 [Candida albicans L26]|nr:programmed cell death protein 5 [Candida albicans P37005]KGT63453.1 programmed cell death protein 5 [Candida albicans 12C]KGU01413.1 programmed cell death protein 5 [Candida albicans L26]KGU01644.1 programmed cell death protein 5 [Candida albicans 19F]KHC43907.1 programmed cell death protein 5 [Candida albicans P60002]